MIHFRFRQTMEKKKSKFWRHFFVLSNCVYTFIIISLQWSASVATNLTKMLIYPHTTSSCKTLTTAQSYYLFISLVSVTALCYCMHATECSQFMKCGYRISSLQRFMWFTWLFACWAGK